MRFLSQRGLPLTQSHWSCAASFKKVLVVKIGQTKPSCASAIWTGNINFPHRASCKPDFTTAITHAVWYRVGRDIHIRRTIANRAYNGFMPKITPRGFPFTPTITARLLDYIFSVFHTQLLLHIFSYYRLGGWLKAIYPGSQQFGNFFVSYVF